MNEVLHTKFGNAKIDDIGYYRITSHKEGNHKKLLHRLIFEDFYNIDLDEEFPEGVVIHHEDGNPLNNKMWNLIPMTLSEHNSLHNTGENNPNWGKPLSYEAKEKLSKAKTSTGFFRVTKRIDLTCNNGFIWAYQYYDEKGKRKAIRRVNLGDLEKEVMSRGFDWIVLDEEKARKTMETLP